MNWIDKLLPPPMRGERSRSSVPEGLWIKCANCKEVLYRPDLESALMVCHGCGNHMKMNARARIDHLLDKEGRQEIGQEILPIDILRFKDSKKYAERLKQGHDDSGETDVLVSFYGTIDQHPVVVSCFEFDFMGGSMGAVVGERFARAVALAVEQKVGFICFAASGGARMQEGLISLMQMAKTNAALTRLERLRLPFISVLTNPTMGGVSASFAFMGDLVIAEPNALVGFAGQRVIANTVKGVLPEGFQRAEFVQQKGGVDIIVDRRQMKAQLRSILKMLTP